MPAYANEYSAAHPQPTSDADRHRVEEQARRYRILNEVWMEDALDREAAFFSEDLRASMPTPELSRNPALMIFRQIATLYDQPPEVAADDTDPEDLEILDLHLLWAQSQERSLYVEGVNECLMRTDWLDADGDGMGRISYRVVPPHMVLCARTDHEDANRIVYVEELRWSESSAVQEVTNAAGEVVQAGRAAHTGWVVEVWDLTGPTPRHARRLVSAQGSDLGEQGGAWPEGYTDAAGPIMPYTIYHRTVSDKTWNPNPGRGVFIGTLTTACLWTFWLFGFRDASYDQRAIIDGTVKGISPGSSEPGSAQGVTTDPRVVLQIKSDGERSAQLAQWSKSVDVKSSGESVEQFMAGLALYAGISPSDITLGSSTQSGYAIVVSRDGQRKARLRQMVPARIGDRSVLMTAARLLNRNAGTTLPTERRAWSIVYAPIQESPGERKARTDDVLSRLEAGMLSPVAAYQELNPGTSEQQALDALTDIARARALLSTASTPADQTATVSALMALGDNLPRRSFYAALRRVGLLDPAEDIEALIAAAAEPETEEEDTTPEDAQQELADNVGDALAILRRIQSGTPTPEDIADALEALTDAAEILGLEAEAPDEEEEPDDMGEDAPDAEEEQ